jgi:hypothetical protein
VSLRGTIMFTTRKAVPVSYGLTERLLLFNAWSVLDLNRTQINAEKAD